MIRFFLGLLFLGLLVPPLIYAGIQFSVQVQYFQQLPSDNPLERLNALESNAEYARFDYHLSRELAYLNLQAGRPRSATQHLHHAIEARPSWPYSWLDLARAFAMQGDYSENFRFALEQTHQLGRNSVAIAWGLASLGLDTLDKPMEKPAYELLESNLRSGLQRFNKKLLGQAILSGKLNTLCNLNWERKMTDMVAWCKGAIWLTTQCAKPETLTQRKRRRCERMYAYWEYKATQPLR